MTDIFREVEEEVRRERFEQLWKRYGAYVIGAVVLIAVVVGGYALWTRHMESRRQADSAAYMAAVGLAESGKPLDAAARFDELAKNGTEGYAQLARMARGDALLIGGKPQEAITEYRLVSEQAETELGNAARMRAAWAMVETAPKAEIEKVVRNLTDGASEWRFMAREVLAYSDYAHGRLDAASKGYNGIAQDMSAPESVRRRAAVMVEFIAVGGDRSFGTMPLAPSTTTAPAQVEGQAQ